LESVDLTSALRIKRNSGLTPFLADLLFIDVLFALQDRSDLYIDAREVTNTIIQSLLSLPTSPIYSPPQISQVAADVLKQFDRRAWQRFAAEHPSVAI
jgi:transcriptional regulator NrdR family protein